MGCKCNKCNTKIRWIKIGKDKFIPLDKKPIKMWTLNETHQEYEVRDCYTSHFDTCPEFSNN